MRSFFLVFIICLLTGCATSGYKEFYQSYGDPGAAEDIELLADGEEPAIYSSNDLRRDGYLLRSKRYVPIGVSAFNGPYEDTDNALRQAKRIGASVVLVNSEYTNSETVTSALVLPDTQTTYSSGTVNANTSYSSQYGGYLGSSDTFGTYSGTSTTYGTKTVPYTQTYRRYDQMAVYFAKFTGKFRYGVFLADLQPDQRVELGRNTGAVVDVVVEDTPAFLANMMPGDVILAVDDMTVLDADQARQFMAHTPADARTSTLRVLRNGEEKLIEIRF